MGKSIRSTAKAGTTGKFSHNSFFLSLEIKLFQQNYGGSLLSGNLDEAQEHAVSLLNTLIYSFSLP